MNLLRFLTILLVFQIANTCAAETLPVFTDVSKESNVFQPNGRAMSAIIADLNNDGFLDIYIFNDAMENYYYRNTGKGKFENEGLILGLFFSDRPEMPLWSWRNYESRYC